MGSRAALLWWRQRLCPPEARPIANLWPPRIADRRLVVGASAGAAAEFLVNRVPSKLEKSGTAWVAAGSVDIGLSATINDVRVDKDVCLRGLPQLKTKVERSSTDLIWRAGPPYRNKKNRNRVNFGILI